MLELGLFHSFNLSGFMDHHIWGFCPRRNIQDCDKRFFHVNHWAINKIQFQTKFAEFHPGSARLYILPG